VGTEPYRLLQNIGYDRYGLGSRHKSTVLCENLAARGLVRPSSRQGLAPKPKKGSRVAWLPDIMPLSLHACARVRMRNRTVQTTLIPQAAGRYSVARTKKGFKSTGQRCSLDLSGTEVRAAKKFNCVGGLIRRSPCNPRIRVGAAAIARPSDGLGWPYRSTADREARNWSPGPILMSALPWS
jgi:hypothetical protein